MIKSRTIYLLRQAQLTVYARMIDRLRPFEMTPTQYMVLSLSSSDVGLSSAALARRADITPQSMNEIIAILERKGLLRRRESSENRRILRITLTKEGTRILTQCNRELDEMEEEVFGDFSQKDLSVFRKCLTKVLHPDAQAVEWELEQAAKDA